jgi:hypothetical protein
MGVFAVMEIEIKPLGALAVIPIALEAVKFTAQDKPQQPGEFYRY